MTAQGGVGAIWGYEDDLVDFDFEWGVGGVRAEAGGGNAGDARADGGPLAHGVADAVPLLGARDDERWSGGADRDSGGDESGQGADHGAAE